MGKVKKASFAIGLIIIFVFLYCHGAIEHFKKVNTNMNRTDQGSYMNYAAKMYETKYAHVGHRNQMPVYPFLQSLFYSSDMTIQEFFVQGKYINIVLSLIILLCLFFILQKYFTLLHAINITLITAFTVFIFKAAYFQCELLFYFLNFCSFLLMCKMFINPNWKLGAITGIVLGIAHLTKASILPGLILFLFFATAKMIYVLSLDNSQVLPLLPGFL